MAPDLPAMSGGLRIIYQFAEHLDRLGFPACVWHGTDRANYPGFDSDARVVRGLTQQLGVGDLLVMPEVGGARWADLNPGVPTVMLVQGSDFVFADSAFDVPPAHAYPGWPQARAVLTVSETLADFLHEVLPEQFPLFRVPLRIDTDLYRPLAKQRLVAFMPRRRREDLLAVVHLLHRQGRLSQGWSLLPIDGMSPVEVARAMGSAAIFLNAGEREGFGLPGAEAMAAGCYVIGFSGHGAREYMAPGVSEIIAESDVVAMAQGVGQAMDEYDQDQAAFAQRSAAGRALIEASYGASAQAEALTRAFTALLGSAAVTPAAVVAAHYESRAPQTTLARAYVQARTKAGAWRRRWAAR